jgi:hypothetical protein
LEVAASQVGGHPLEQVVGSFQAPEPNIAVSGLLERPNVFCAGALGALSLGIGHTLPLSKVFESSVDIRHVEENVLAGPGVDEAEAPVRESFDRSFWHALDFLISPLQSAQQPCLGDHTAL